MTPPDLSSIIYGLPEPILLVEPEGTVVGANSGASRLFRRPSRELVGKHLSALFTDDPEKLTRYLRQCSGNSEGIPDSVNIQPSSEEPIPCKAIGGLVHQCEQQPRLVWLRLLPRDSANTRFAAYNEPLQALAKDSRALQQNDQRWRTAFESSAIGIMMADFAGRFFAANRVFRNMLGYTESELYQLTFLDVTYEEDRKANLELIRELVEGKRQHFEMEKRYCRKDGTLLSVRINVALVPGMGDVAPFWFGVVEDIAQRKRVEEELRLQIEVQVRQAAVRAEVSVAFGKKGNLKAILRECAETIVLHLDAAFAGIWTSNEVGDTLELQASAGMYIHLDGVHSRIPMGKLKIGMIAQERKPLLTNDVLNDPRISDNDWQENGGMVGFAGYPLIVGDRTIGVLAMFSKQSVTTGTLEALASAADLIAQGIERKLAEDKLRASERSLRELTETIPQMLWSAEADGAVDYLNQRVLDYTGLPAEQVRGAGWMRAVHQDDIEKMAQAWTAAVSTGKPFRYEFRCLRAADHAYRWCISSALPLRDQKGRIIKWFGSVVDLHDWKVAQQALQTTQMELARVSRLTTMGELAASIAHEVNQPLTAVTNNSNACLRLLADHNLEPEVLRRALEEIVADGTRASAVIARIRAFVMKAPAEKNELDINEVIQEVLALTGCELEENRVLLERQLTKALPRVLGDRVQLQQVLLNLIMNGIEAMTAVASRPRLLWVQSRIDEYGNVLVAVRDSGTGLGLEADRFFTPFFTTKANGMGMGLSISRSLVEGHGGRLWATPNSPHGAVFYFTLPVGAGSPS